MFIPRSIYSTISSVLDKAYEDAKEIPSPHRNADPDDYKEALDWIDNHLKDTIYLEDGPAVEASPSLAETGDLYQLEYDTEWKRVIGVDMTPGDTHIFTIAGADPRTGEFAGIDFVYDTDMIQVMTNCRKCTVKPATEEWESETTGFVTLVCSDCL